MSNIALPPYEQPIQNVSDPPLSASMDTSPIPSDIPSFLAAIPSSLPDPTVQSQFQDQPTVSAMIAPMHLSMPDLSSPSFMSQIDPDPVPHLHTAPPGFLPDTTHPDPFNTMVPPPIDNNSMSLEMSPASVALSSPSSHSQPSPSVHGVASAYPPGVTSSLESALDQSGVSGNRSRANTSVSPTSIPSSFLSMTPPAQQQQQQPMDLSFHSSDNAVTATEQEEATILIQALLTDIAKTANSAGIDYKYHPHEATHKVDELKERISRVSELMSMFTIGEPPATSYPPPFPSQGSGPPPPPPPVTAPVPIPEPSVGFPSVPPAALNPPIDLRAQLTVPDHSRKRCASDLEEQRTVKAPKREAQDDQPLSFAPTIEAPAPLPVETSQMFPTAGISLPQAAALPLVVSQSQPPSRPPTPSAFAVRPSFSPTKQQTPVVPNYPSYASAPPAPIDFTSTISPSVASSSPTFPGLHTSWTDPAVPTVSSVSSRHHPSSSVGSVTGVQAAMETFVNPLSPTTQVPPQAIPIANSVSATVSQPIGRMSRSGSISGAPFASTFSFGYPPSDTSAPNWANLGRVANPGPASHTSQTTWFIGGAELSRSSASPSTSDAAGTIPSTTRNSPSDDENDDDDDSDENETNRGNKTTNRPSAGDGSSSSSSSDVPAEYRAEVDRIFFEYLNKICSNLEATDSKGEPIHQTLMAKKMQRLDESPDFRPFKFRIQAFTLAFLEELARQGYPEEKIPMKKVRNYLWRQQYILRFNEDGKKAKSKGNHIWNIEAKKAGDGKWEFRPFHRKLAGTPPAVAYSGLKWQWSPRIWDPQASWQNVPVQYSSPNLPSWLSWKEDILSGIPPPDAESCQITVNAKFTLDGQEGQLSHTFNLTVAPVSTLDSGSFSRSRRPSLAGEPPKRSTSDSALFQVPQRSKVRVPPPPVESPDTRVIRVLQSVAQRVTEEAESQFVSASPPKETLQDLVKQKHVLEQTVTAYDKEISGMGHAQTRQLAVAAQNVVVQAAHTVIADRSLATGVLPPRQSETPSGAIQSVTVNELTDATQDAIAMAVKSQGTASTEVDIIVAAASILKARTSSIDATSNAVAAQAAMPLHRAVAPTMLSQSMVPGYPSNLASLPEYS